MTLIRKRSDDLVIGKEKFHRGGAETRRNPMIGGRTSMHLIPRCLLKSNAKPRSGKGGFWAPLEYNSRMKTSLLQRVVCLLMIYVLLVPQTWATCGGGGGGGMGGMGGGSSQT